MTLGGRDKGKGKEKEVLPLDSFGDGGERERGEELSYLPNLVWEALIYNLLSTCMYYYLLVRPCPIMVTGRKVFGYTTYWGLGGGLYLEYPRLACTPFRQLFLLWEASLSFRLGWAV